MTVNGWVVIGLTHRHMTITMKGHEMAVKSLVITYIPSLMGEYDIPVQKTALANMLKKGKTSISQYVYIYIY